jgi:HlyD family secretion protein
MKSFVIIFILLLQVTFSCNNNKFRILTYNLKRSDFVEKINVTGTVQAVNNYSVVAPRISYGPMTVTHLVEDGSYVKEGDTICILSSPDLSSSYEALVTDLENMEADLIKLEADNALNLALLKAQLETTNIQMKISSLDSAKMKFVPPANQKLLALEMEKYTIEKKKIERKFISQKTIDDSEIRQMKSRIMQQQMRVQTMKDQINSLTIIASREGFVMHMEAPIVFIMSSSGTSGSMGGKIEEGSSVFSNMGLVQFPDLNKMQVSLNVAESDYKRIEKGQKVSISIDAVKNLNTAGRVNRKMLIGKTRQSDSKVKTYEVIVDIDSCHLKMKPGLSASCEITVAEVEDTIFVPSLSIFEIDSLSTVYVLEGDKFIPVTIKAGQSNSSHTIIAEGLKGNETIALSEPPHNLIKTHSKNKR